MPNVRLQNAIGSWPLPQFVSLGSGLIYFIYIKRTDQVWKKEWLINWQFREWLGRKRIILIKKCRIHNASSSYETQMTSTQSLWHGMSQNLNFEFGDELHYIIKSGKFWWGDNKQKAEMTWLAVDQAYKIEAKPLGCKANKRRTWCNIPTWNFIHNTHPSHWPWPFNGLLIWPPQREADNSETVK